MTPEQHWLEARELWEGKVSSGFGELDVLRRDRRGGWWAGDNEYQRHDAIRILRDWARETLGPEVQARQGMDGRWYVVDIIAGGYLRKDGEWAGDVDGNSCWFPAIDEALIAALRATHIQEQPTYSATAWRP